MKITEKRLRAVIRSVIKETAHNEMIDSDIPNDEDLQNDPELMNDILITAQSLSEGVKIASRQRVRSLKESSVLNSKGVEEFVASSLDANGKLIALYNLDLHGNHNKTFENMALLTTGGLTAYASYSINVLGAHAWWVKMFGATIAGGAAALNTIIGLSVALGAVGFWLAKKAIKKASMSDVLVPDWYEVKEFKKKIKLNKKDLISMSIEELCNKYDIPMP